jgi:penicillin amidase
MKTVKKLAAAALVVALLLTVVILQVTPLGPILSYRIRPSHPVNRDESLPLERLGANVDVYFDDFGIPHIEAANATDLARAVGFVQSRYRFFQLDVLRRFGQGRISELVGEQKILFSTTVEFDLAMRGWGFEERSRLDPDGMPEFDREVIRAFTDGVNQALDRHPPLEYAILGVEPEPWTPSDCLMVALVQAWSITHNWEQEAVRLSLALHLGVENADAIYPNHPIGGTPTIAPAGEPEELPPAIAPEILDLFPAGPDLERISRGRNEPGGFALGSLAELRPSASNAWVVSGERSESGMPILSNDMHLSHMLPSLLFLQHVKTPQLDAVGVTMPGLPFLVGGHNGRIAWGATSAVADVVDLVLEREDPRRDGFVLNEARECRLENDQAVIRVRDGDDFEERRFPLRRTCNGPLLNDMYPEYLPDGSPLVSIRWKLPQVQRSIGHLYRANRSETLEALRDSLMQLPSPVQNIMAADTEGRIAFFSTGSVPIRNHHRGTFPAPGWLGRFEWAGWTEAEDMPLLRDPEIGYIVNTNNKVVSPYHHRPLFHVDSAPSYRSDRAIERILAIPRHDRASIGSIQLDSKILRARAVLPHILRELVKDAELGEIERKALVELREWDRFADPDSVGALLFYSVYRAAIVRALETKVSDAVMHVFLRQRYSTNVVDLWFEDSHHVVWDDFSTEEKEDRGSVVREAFRDAVAKLQRDLGSDVGAWRWGVYHFLHPKHLFGGRSILGFMNLPKIELSGGLDSVWKAHFNFGAAEESFRVVAGPAFRFVADLASLEDAEFGIDTGESGWPLSPHYGDMYEEWRRGELAPMHYDWEQIRRESPAHLKLVRAGAPSRERGP